MKTRAALVLCVLFAALMAPICFAQDLGPGGGFKGTYEVGSTRCLVTPVRMAYEVRWPGVRQPEYYFYDEKSSTDSAVIMLTDPAYTPGPVRKFIFSSRQMEEGFYVGKDSRKLPVRRVAAPGDGQD